MNDPEQLQGPPAVDRGAAFFNRLSNALVQRLARGRIYYGWYIVAVVFLVGISRVGFSGSFFGIFLKPMSEEFGWTRTETTWAVTIGTLVAAGLGLVLGKVLDRYGPRWMMVSACALLAASFFGLSRINTLVVFYLVYSVGRSMMQSATGHTLMYALVSKWFVRRRAVAISAAAFGGYVGGIFLAPMTQRIIDGYSWRQAWVFFGFLTMALALVPSLLFLRRTPEDLGLLPDGDVSVSAPAGSGAPVAVAASLSDAMQGPFVGADSPEMNFTLQEALRSVSFWLLTFMVSINSVATTGVTFHMVPHFTDGGVSNAVAAASVSVLTLSSMASVFVWGFVADRLGAKKVLSAVLLSLAVGAFLISRADAATTVYASAGVFGLAMGGYDLLSEVVWADYFGRRYLGSIRGVALVLQLVGNASGSLIAAFLHDQRGDYHDAFKVIIVALLASFAMLSMARRPKPREADVAWVAGGDQPDG